MSDRQLTISVHYDDNGATAKVKQLDAAVDGVGTTATTKTTPAVSAMSNAMKLALAGAALTAAHEVGQLALELIRMGDQIKRVSDRTGLSTTAVQQLGYIAEQSGNSLDQITQALGQMQNRLASGDKSAVAGVQALGLEMTTLLNMRPEDQFFAIGTAIASIEDPAVRSQLAMDLFGRSGMTILPTLVAEFQKLRAEAPVMAEQTVNALDKIGDAINRLVITAKVAAANWAAEGLKYGSGLFGGTAGMLLQGLVGDGPDMPGSGVSKGRNTTLVNDASQLLTDYSITVKGVAEATKGAATATRTFTAAVGEAAVEASQATVEFRLMGGMLVQVIPGAGEAARQFAFLGWALDPIVGRQLPEMIALLPQVAAAATKASGPIASFFEGIKRGGAGLIDGLTGGQGLAGFFSNIGFGITQQLGSILTGGISQLINWGIEQAWRGIKAIANMFGPGQEWTDVKTARSAFEGQFGGLEGFQQAIGDAFGNAGKSAADTSAAILAFWNAKDMASLTAAMQVLKDALDGKFTAATGGGGYTSPAVDDLPQFASGGVIDAGRGTLAMLHGREAIVPLDRPGRGGLGGSTTVIINNPEIDSQVGLERFTRRMEQALDRAARRARAI